MAKKRKIANMTRAEHKHALEKAVGLQTAAMREMGGQVFLPRLDRQDGDLYTQVVKAGKELLQKHCDKSETESISNKDRIVSYYSRSDVQQALYQYARGRKICVLRNFHPMFHGSGLREPQDLLPIMVFYSQEPGLWPSIHGTVSRQDDKGRSICDLVVEVDFKKSRERSFNLSRPLIKLFQNLELEFRVKFSGNASPHIIIPAETFPQQWRSSGRCRYLYAKLLDFLKSQIKQPNALDGSFRNPGHFLRMPYSINEKTGLVSTPIRIEDYSRFSWEMARPESVVVMDDWWSIPDDAVHRAEALIEVVLGQKKTFTVKREAEEPEREFLRPQMPDVIGPPVQMGMVKAGEEIAARGSTLMQKEVEGGVNKGDALILKRWMDGAEALTYYSRPDVQEAIFSYVQGRCVHLSGTEEYLLIQEPSDIYALAAYTVGGGLVPEFRCTNATYEPESGDMIVCDMVIRVDSDMLNAVSLLFRSGNMQAFVLYNGGKYSWIVIPFHVMESSVDANSPLLGLPDMAEAFRRYFRRMLRSSDGIRISLHESPMPVPYSLADDGKNINLPLRLEDVSRITPNMTGVSEIGTIEKIDSLTPNDAPDRTADFLRSIAF